MAARPNVHTIHAASPFLETLLDGLLDGRLIPGFAPRGDPLALASATIFLPTRRAIRALREIILDRLGGEAALMPRLLALGEIDEDEALFDAGPDALDLAEAVRSTDRQIALTRLILMWSTAFKGALLAVDGEDEPLLIPSSYGDAAALAATLGRFIDELEIEQVLPETFARLTTEHAGRYDQYWDITLRFLEIALAQWPAHLGDISRLDAATRRNLLIGAEAKRLADGHQRGPTIVAGSTGSIPATRALIKAVAHHASGAVVLPGLDRDLDEAGWRAITGDPGAPGHPQAGLKALIEAIGIERGDIAVLGTPDLDRAARAGLLSEAMRPAATTDQWAARDVAIHADPAAFADVTLIEAAQESEEALAVALVLRESLEAPGRRAALVTPDRGLAARVVAELGRWGITADDSAGRPLLATPPGILARLVLDVALSDFAPVDVLALAKHPLSAFGLGRGRVRNAALALEIGALRGPRPPAGIAGLRKALAAGQAEAGKPHAMAARKAMTRVEWAAATDLLDALERAIAPFAAILQDRGARPAQAFFAAHIAAVEATAGEGHALYEREAGEALAALFAELLAVGPGDLALPGYEYPGLFAALAGGRSVRGGEPAHPRIAIYGLLEARLLPVDRVVLGGLDEGVWPATVRADPWLNRPMRATIELPPPEKRIGLAAHDFEQAFGTREVFITRALKRGGAPSVEARWLQRLRACLGPTAAGMVARGQAWRELAAGLDAPAAPAAPLRAPKPRPPLALRPTRLSVTEIETLVRDPYSIYARRVLGLEALPDLAEAPAASDRGTLIHEAASRFAALCRDGVPGDALRQLADIGNDLFAAFADYPDVQAFWRPRFDRIAGFLVGWERARRPGVASLAIEIAGKSSWATAAGRSFELRARADRIEIDRTGAATIIDFKTGAAPSIKQVQSGMSPQLALEAAMLMESAFAVPAQDRLAPPLIVQLSGLGEGGREKIILFENMTTEAAASHSMSRLKALIDRFEDEATPYASLLHPMFKGRRFGDYDHLARVSEWSLAGDSEGEA